MNSTKPDDFQSILESIKRGDLNNVKLLIEKGVHFCKYALNDSCSLHKSVINSNIELVQYIIEQGVKINAKDEDGWTPLEYAIEHNCIQNVKMLIDNGAKLTIGKYWFETPFIKNAIKNIKMLELLIDNNVIDINFLDEDGDTLLLSILAYSKSVSDSQSEIVKLLIRKGTDVNYETKYGYTPLTHACEHEQLKIVKILLDSRANPNIMASEAPNVIESCCDNKSIKMFNLLISYGANIELLARYPNSFNRDKYITFCRTILK